MSTTINPEQRKASIRRAFETPLREILKKVVESYNDGASRYDLSLGEGECIDQFIYTFGRNDFNAICLQYGIIEPYVKYVKSPLFFGFDVFKFSM